MASLSQLGAKMIDGETFSLYKGEVSLRFEAEKHRYTVGDMIVDGVTSVLNIIDKPALIQWAANEAAAFVRENLKPGVSLDELQIEELAKSASLAHRVKKEKAANIGTITHNWIEEYIKNGRRDLPVNEQARKGAEAFLEWVATNHVEFVDSERKIYSKLHNYAGTLDFEAVVNGKRIIGDIKTSSGIYPTMFLQTAAYEMARTEEDGIEYAGNIIVNCRKDGTLKVGEVWDAQERKKNCQSFLAALILYRNLKT